MNTETYSTESNDLDTLDDMETDVDNSEEAVNDEEYSPYRQGKANTDTRRRVEALLEERRLKKMIDDWDDWGE
ncbi:hypothetical protein LMG33818_001094 [Halomonadaceae bacterium LMG 33818]|uniref:PA3496 family putative envelope integrity protein n=1 Tax=Cernens ardua TaxID=3402176 RepID=UPI003EDBE4B7